MSWKILLLSAAMLVPLAMAHNPAGTTKDYCEPFSEWNVHDYTGTAGASSVSARPPLYDGNLNGDCNGNGVPFDYDVHHEWGAGWARLDVITGDGVTNGALACYGTFGHHPQFGPFLVEDVAFGQTVHFFVMADSSSIVAPTSGPDCGDGQITPCPGRDPEQGGTGGGGPCLGNDGFAEFIGGIASVSFPPGIDGSYYVVVVDNAVGGHITA